MICRSIPRPARLRIALAQKYADRHKLFEGDRKDASSYHFRG